MLLPDWTDSTSAPCSAVTSAFAQLAYVRDDEIDSRVEQSVDGRGYYVT